MKHLKDHSEDIYKCTRCGLCQSKCPAYEVTKQESVLSRGFFQLLNGILLGHLSFTKNMTKILDKCLVCNACTDFCPSEIQAEEIILSARYEDFKKNGLSWRKKLISFAFNSNLHLKIIGLFCNIYRALGLTASHKILNIPELWMINNLLTEKIQPLQPKQITEKKNLKIFYFAGCINTYINKSAKNSVKIILETNGFDVNIPDFSCCGVPARNFGDFDTFKELAKKNLDLIPDDIDYLLSDCASCSLAFKAYIEALDGEYKEKAEKVFAKALNINEFILKYNLNSVKSKKNKKITYHAPCHLERGLKVIDEPREVLKGISGIEYTEMKDADLCCGAAGSYFITCPEISKKISYKKAENIENTGSDIVCTSCSGCTIGLLQGLSLKNQDIKVYQTVELLAECIIEED